MKLLIAGFLAFMPAFAFAEDVPLPRPRPIPSVTCVNLTGAFQLPLQKHDRSDNPQILRINQDQCRLINVSIGYYGVITLIPDASLDGSEGYSIVGDTIVLTAQPNSELSIPTNHGGCKAKSLTFALDAKKDLVLSSSKIYDCEDNYSGAYSETLPRLN